MQTAIDPVQNQGKGLGIAPHRACGNRSRCHRNCCKHYNKITYQDDWNWSAIEGYVNSTIDAYFSQLNANWANNENIVVRINQIESALLGVTGVLDITGTTLNGAEQNLVINADSIPKRGLSVQAKQIDMMSKVPDVLKDVREIKALINTENSGDESAQRRIGVVSEQHVCRFGRRVRYWSLGIHIAHSAKADRHP